jgi:sugar lactone lactonase YvrE
MNDLVAALVAPISATLGEGPVWVERDQSLWFVDIKQKKILQFTPDSGNLREWNTPDQVGWLLPASGGSFLIGMSDGLYHFDPETNCFDLVYEVEGHILNNRLNDATADRQGRVWFGSMDNTERERSGRLYRFEDWVVTDCGLDAVCITNGPAVSPDGRILYFVDTLARAIDAFTIRTDGELCERRRFVTLTSEDGFPDGVTCDVEGGVWLGLFQGWSARRYAPDGVQTHEVRFPVANVTKVALGGADRCTAYATTARLGLDEAALRAQPLAGHLFTFRVDVPGQSFPSLAL